MGMFNLNIKKYISIIAVILLLIFLHFTGIIAPLESLIVKIINPALSKFYSAGLYISFVFNQEGNKNDLEELLKENDKKISELIAENARIKSLEEENEILRGYLKFSKESSGSLVLGNIISRVGLNANNADPGIIIDKGRKNGIVPGAAVISGNGIIAGKVTNVKDNISEICLITNPHCKFAATILNNEKTSGIVRGELGLTIIMEFIPQTDEVKNGDIVISSGLENNIPRGLVIGRIVEVLKGSNELWQSATIEPVVNLDKLLFVSVLNP